MHIEVGNIIKNLVADEPVIIQRIQPLGNMFSVRYIGVNSQKSNSRTISHEEFYNLEVLAEEGSFNFQGNPTRFKLYAEAERINSAYQFDPLFAVNCSIVDPLPHQVEAVYKFLLPQPQIRFLLADDTGAGKTIMTGLLLKELMLRGMIERILIVTPGGLTKQWQEDELGVKFNMNFTLVNRGAFNADPNIFQTAKKIVTSIDFIRQEDVMNVMSTTYWDLIVIDESHKLSAYEYGAKQYVSKRYEAAYNLSKQCEHLLLLTATPHRGRQDTFKKLLQLLDEDIFATADLASERVKDLEHDGVNKFFIRRLKEDMRSWEGEPLFKARHTKTVAYELTPEEKGLYDAVTNYLAKKKEEASENRNIHVSLALTVMQRRLVSSIRAIRNTLERRWLALQGIVDEITKNPGLWKQRQKIEEFDVDNLDDYDELDDEERDALDSILSDPKKFKLFTTAKSIGELQQEANEVKKLFEMAESLHNRRQPEKKFLELQDLLKSKGVLDGEKLVIFTEHKDTLLYLEERLRDSGGYKVATIHGGKTVDERRQAQWDFAKPDTQILIATDAAGEGINLQFCRLLINWDIPWNPNRLEQRMGRIHRYGQKQEVMVFNMVASNTREGKVLKRLLEKLDVIRESMGDDRVYDVIQDVMEGIALEDILNSVMNGKNTNFDDFLNQDNENLKMKFQEKIEDQKKKLAHSTVNYQKAKELKESSDERRLQPIYIKLFFEKAFQYFGGSYTELRPSIFKINSMPQEFETELLKNYNIRYDNIKSIKFCFDKEIFLEYQNLPDLGRIHYINPGNPVFDTVVDVVRKKFKEDMLKGTVLISPDDKDDFFAFFVKSQIVDRRPSSGEDSLAHEKITMVFQDKDNNYHLTSPAKFIDLKAPKDFTKEVQPPPVKNTQEVIQWSFENITLPQFEDTKLLVEKDIEDREEYLKSAFTQVIMDLQTDINEMQGKLLMGETKHQDLIEQKQNRIKELTFKRDQRIESLQLMTQLNPKEPEILGCAYVIPLNQVEYKSHYGMSRDDEAEAVAMNKAMEFEKNVGWEPHDVSNDNEGYDIRSVSPEGIKRYIEVKGRNGADGSIMLSENEMNRLAQLGDSAWLYIVTNCKTLPQLFRIQNPAQNLRFEHKSKGVQYFLPMKNWKHTIKE